MGISLFVSCRSEWLQPRGPTLHQPGYSWQYERTPWRNAFAQHAMGWCQPLKWGTLPGSPLGNNRVKVFRVWISESYNTVRIKRRLFSMMFWVMLAFRHTLAWMVGSSAVVWTFQGERFSDGFSAHLESLVSQCLRSLSVGWGRTPCFSIPCLWRPSLLRAVCGRRNLLRACTKPAWISRFGWGCQILRKGLIKPISVYTVEGVITWIFLWDCFVWRNCLSKNRQTNPCKKDDVQKCKCGYWSILVLFQQTL